MGSYKFKFAALRVRINNNCLIWIFQIQSADLNTVMESIHQVSNFNHPEDKEFSGMVIGKDFYPVNVLFSETIRTVFCEIPFITIVQGFEVNIIVSGVKRIPKV